MCVGVLIHNPLEWSRTLALEFHALRESERESGRLIIGPGTELWAWLERNPIYRVEYWDVAKAAFVVDHIIPHKGDPELMWSEWNWQPVTKHAHDKKTARERRATVGSQTSEVSR